MLRSGICDYSDAQIVVKGNITVTDPVNNVYDKKIAFNNAPFTSCVLKINNTLIDNAEYLHIVMPMYNLNEYSKNYLKATRRLWNYYRDELNSGAEGSINYSIKIQNLLIIKQRLQEDQKATIQKRKLKLLYR